MSNYIHDNDGKLHTRYSELARCTPGQMDRIIAERVDGSIRYESEAMAFGTERHEMWSEEGLKTGQTAKCFGRQWAATHVEREFAVEIAPDVVLHSRPDSVSEPDEAVHDYKTMVCDSYEDGFLKAHAMYGKSKQLAVYALQLTTHGIRIRKMVYLVELWNRERTEIFGYVIVEKNITLGEIAKTRQWLMPRIALLASALEMQEVPA